MARMKIEMLGSEVLRRKAEDVPEPGPELDRLIDDMFETMYDAHGIGLAAPQVGLSQRLLVIDLKEEGSRPMALLDARIVETGGPAAKAEEGCLSIPGISGVVERPESVVVEARNRQGEPIRIEADGLLSRCLQHEIDHLEGVLFLDRLSPIKRSMLLKKWKKLNG